MSIIEYKRPKVSGFGCKQKIIHNNVSASWLISRKIFTDQDDDHRLLGQNLTTIDLLKYQSNEVGEVEPCCYYFDLDYVII